MKKPLRIFTVLYAAAAVCGCSVEDAFYDEVIDDPGYYVFNNAYPWQVANFFRCAEMADFFTAYRGIKEDRDASEKLADRYFGESWSELFYEKIVIPGIGTLYYVDDGVYSFYPSFYPDWDSADYCMDVKMEAGYMKISSSSGTFPAEARMSVENGVVNMDYLSSVYREKGSGYTMTVSTEGTSGTVSMPMCGSDGFSYVPQSIVRTGQDRCLKGRVSCLVFRSSSTLPGLWACLQMMLSACMYIMNFHDKVEHLK